MMKKNTGSPSWMHNYDFLKPECRPVWKKRFERYLSWADASAKSDADKLVALRSIMGEEIDQVLAQLMPDTKDKTLTNVVQAFSDYLFPQKNVILERYQFNSRIQNSGESVDQFVTALRILAESCRYGTMKDELIRDQLIFGLLNTKTSVVLRFETDLTLEQAVAIARQTDPTWDQSDNESDDAAEGPNEEELKTEALYRRVRRVLKRLTSWNYDTLVNRVRSLQIDSQERLRGVIALVFKKAVIKPCCSAAYALMCKELAMMQVSSSDTEARKEERNVNFRKLIATHCQTEFEKNTFDEIGSAIKMKQIEACPDPDMKKDLLQTLKEEERKIRNKSVSRMRFIGELFKQGILTTNIMHRCIRYLLQQTDEESLECLCKLLSTIGKDLESKQQCLHGYLMQMHEIANCNGRRKVSSKIRVMLHDVVELGLHKWVPCEVINDPKTIDQITPKEDNRNRDRKQNPPAMAEDQLVKKTDNIVDANLFDTNVDKLESSSGQPSMEQIHERLRSLISNEEEYSFENVVSWISANVGERAKEPQFIRVLMTTILEVSIEPYNQTWKFKAEKFQNLQNLICRYIDANELLELNCLFAIQEYIHKLEHPSGVLLQVIEKLSDDSVISDEAFLKWQSNEDPSTQTGRTEAMMALTSFFRTLKETKDDDISDDSWVLLDNY